MEHATACRVGSCRSPWATGAACGIVMLDYVWLVFTLKQVGECTGPSEAYAIALALWAPQQQPQAGGGWRWFPEVLQRGLSIVSAPVDLTLQSHHVTLPACPHS